MPATDQPTLAEQQLTQALDELCAALAQASDAANTIRGIIPGILATGSVLDEIEALVRAGRASIGATEPPAYARPTLVVPAGPPSRPRSLGKRRAEGTSDSAEPASTNGSYPSTPPPDAAPNAEEALPPTNVEPPPAVPSATDDPGVTCFRLEFESVGGPLDLRAIDDAVTQHAAVRDVALLDYDGRRAVLKVWITAASSPADVQSDLKDRMPQFVAPGDQVRVAALEDVA